MLEIIRTYYPLLLRGLGITILLAIVGTVGGFFLSLPLVSSRTNKIDKRRDSFFLKSYKTFTNWFSTAYITIFRGTPMIVQAMVFYYGIKMVVNSDWWNPLSAGLIIVTLNTAAYIAEIIRGSVNALDVGQSEAARALGFSRPATMIEIVYPQAIKNSLPAIGNEFIINLKDSAVLSVIGILDLFNATKQVVGATYNVVIPFIITALLYLTLTGLTALLFHKLEKGRKEKGNNEIHYRSFKRRQNV
jgi:putative lysine transport system permease protein